MEKAIVNFLKLFDGYEKAYGQYGGLKEKGNGKVEGQAQTIISDVPVDVVRRHLLGDAPGLGIVPLKEDETVMFGAIDLDIVGVNALTHTIEQIEQKVIRLQLPLVCCTTKSKGIHLYCFTKEPVKATLMIDRLKEWATFLGYGNSEIFPKQSYRINENDVGNWINLPYFGGNDSNRFAVNKNQKLGLDEFFEFAEMMRVPAQELEDFQIEGIDEEYNDAPPCLQIIKDVGMEEGSRNNGLFNFAVYLKKKNEDTWQEDVKSINQEVINPPLLIKEAEEIIKSVSKRDFFYKCKEYPCVQYCNKKECLKRKHGIGTDKSGTSSFQFDNLTKYNSGDEVWWYAECNGKRIQLTTEEILNQTKLQARLLEKLSIVMYPVKATTWMQMIERLVGDCIEIKEPDQASKKGQFFELFDQFLTSGSSAERKDDLIRFNTYIEDGKVYFRGIKLFEYLKNKKMKHTEREVWNWLKEVGAESKKLKVAKKSINVWFVDAPEQFDLEQDEETI